MRNLDLLVESLNFIENHLCEEIKVADIANACCCSKSTLEKLFQCINHISVHEYVVRRRMMLAARRIAEHPEESLLAIALEYGYQSHEAFTRAFKNVWDVNPSEFRNRKFVELYPRLGEPIKEGEMIFMKNVDISQLYDVFQERKNCYFICCDIKKMMSINEIAHKAGDLAIIEALRRMEEAAGEEDMIFRIGGDEFCILTDSSSQERAESTAEKISGQNEKTFCYEEQEIPLSLHVVTAKYEGERLNYVGLFTKLHSAICEGKQR